MPLRESILKLSNNNTFRLSESVLTALDFLIGDGECFKPRHMVFANFLHLKQARGGHLLEAKLEDTIQKLRRPIEPKFLNKRAQFLG
mmetsp:Transcript_29475/g.53372  ORF Transcript_29475/g.53372 Transcript_29475/m.53372 type:complete len:87 (-) Transcript_29475:71-331(-)